MSQNLDPRRFSLTPPQPRDSVAPNIPSNQRFFPPPGNAFPIAYPPSYPIQHPNIPNYSPQHISQNIVSSNTYLPPNHIPPQQTQQNIVSPNAFLSPNYASQQQSQQNLVPPKTVLPPNVGPLPQFRPQNIPMPPSSVFDVPLSNSSATFSAATSQFSNIIPQYTSIHCVPSQIQPSTVMSTCLQQPTITSRNTNFLTNPTNVVGSSVTSSQHAPIYNNAQNYNVPQVISNIQNLKNTETCQNNMQSHVQQNWNLGLPQCNVSFQNFPSPSVPQMNQFYSIPQIQQTFENSDKTDVKMKINPDDQIVMKFLAEKKLKVTSKSNKVSISVAEFRSSLKMVLDLLIQLSIKQQTLSNSMHIDDDSWKEKMNEVKNLKMNLSKICTALSKEDVISSVLVKLQKIKKKRNKILTKRQQNLGFKKQLHNDRILSHQKIDQWLETLRDKDQQQKRETEMKKEADAILSEVRKKITEAKRTIEKLKVFQKLRQARKENAVKKGMFILSKRDKIFEDKVTDLKDTMVRQLADYEAEEKALKVMLDTEQEGQLEEEAQWRIKQLRKHQENRFQDILHGLFGTSEVPQSSDPLYFFWQYYNAANCDINALTKIRHEWDMYLVPRDYPEGSSISQQWVVPEPPSSDLWLQSLDTS